MNGNFSAEEKERGYLKKQKWGYILQTFFLFLYDQCSVKDNGKKAFDIKVVLISESDNRCKKKKKKRKGGKLY